MKHARARKSPQVRPSVIPLAQRSGFDLVEKAFTEEEARAEAARCLQCSTVCDKCVDVCPNRANYTYRITPFAAKLPVISCDDGKIQVVREEEFAIAQNRQILHVDDFCNKCGVCATFCVHDGRPARDKPRLFIDENDFNQQEKNAFHISGNTIRSRNENRESRLVANGDTLSYEDDWVEVTLSPALEVRDISLKKEFEGERSLLHIAEMVTVLRGVEGTLPFLVK